MNNSRTRAPAIGLFVAPALPQGPGVAISPRFIGRLATGGWRLFVFGWAVTISCLSIPSLEAAGRWKAGVASIDITPVSPIWMAGYASRTRPSEGTLAPLRAKALALQYGRDKPAVLVTADLLGFPADVSRRVAVRLQASLGLQRDRIIFSASHTHGGPVVRQLLAVAYDLDAAALAAVEAYTLELEDKIVAVVGSALRGLRPARLSFGQTRATFAVNRRQLRDGQIVGGVNRAAPVDHDVPILRVEGPGRRLLGAVFGYACHNTTLGADFYQFHGDYAGFAQQDLESRFPGAMALFVSGCGADANPSPRGTLELARQYGAELAQAVGQALARRLAEVGGPLRAVYEEVPVAFAPTPPRAEWDHRAQHHESVYHRRHARAMLERIDAEGALPVEYPYPVQAWNFGKDLTLVALAGEVVVDYALRLKRELGGEKLWVAAYCNDVFAYIPSRRVLQEGGYEAGGAMIYYVQPGPFAPSVEETIVGKIQELVGRLRH